MTDLSAKLRELADGGSRVIEWNDEVWLEEFGREYFNVDPPVELTVSRIVRTYVSPVILVAGAVSNILTLLVLRRVVRRAVNAVFYVFLGLLFDLAVLYFRCGNDWIKQLTGKDVQRLTMSSGQSACKLYPFIADFCLYMSVWMTVSMAVDVGLQRAQVSDGGVCVDEKGD